MCSILPGTHRTRFPRGERILHLKMNMQTYDKKVIDCFLKNQLQLFPEEVAQTKEEAEEFLEEVMAVVVNSAKEVAEYFEEEGVDVNGDSLNELLSEAEVFEIGDGRYLIVEA